MAASYVNLVCNYIDGTGEPVAEGLVTFTPSAALADTDGHLIISQAPIVVDLSTDPEPSVHLFATDNASTTPTGWTWLVSPAFPGAPPARHYALPFSGGATQYLSDLTPAT